MPIHPHPQGDCPLLQPDVQKKNDLWVPLVVTWAFSTYKGVTPRSGFRFPNSEELEVSWTSRWLSLEEWLSNPYKKALAIKNNQEKKPFY